MFASPSKTWSGALITIWALDLHLLLFFKNYLLSEIDTKSVDRCAAVKQ
jgi:hypothetical protein